MSKNDKKPDKDCSEYQWRWDSDCLSGTNTSVTGDTHCGSYVTSRCRSNQAAECRTANMATNLSCRNFCNDPVNEDYCQDFSSVRNYCKEELQNGTDLANDGSQICRLVAQDVVKDSCGQSGDMLNNPACTSYCKNHVSACVPAIREHCVGSRIKSSKFCASVLSTKEMWGKHDAEMSKYCNSEAGEKLELCNCVNRKRWQARLKNVSSDVQAILMGRPDCFSQDCTAGTVYKTTQTSGCPSVVNCEQWVSKANISGTSNKLEIVNNCGNKDAASPVNDDGTKNNNGTNNNSENNNGNSPPASGEGSYGSIFGKGEDGTDESSGAGWLFFVFFTLMSMCCCFFMMFMMMAAGSSGGK
jgi:hypothetical protein